MALGKEMALVWAERKRKQPTNQRHFECKMHSGMSNPKRGRWGAVLVFVCFFEFGTKRGSGAWCVCDWVGSVPESQISIFMCAQSHAPASPPNQSPLSPPCRPVSPSEGASMNQPTHAHPHPIALSLTQFSHVFLGWSQLQYLRTII